MKAKLNPKSAVLVALFYIVFSLFASLITAIFFGGAKTDSAKRFIDETIDSGGVAMLVVMVVLLFISLVIFKDSRRDIFFER